MNKLISGAITTVMIIAVLFLNKGCTNVQSDMCRDKGGTPVTRYFDLEYTGCIQP